MPAVRIIQDPGAPRIEGTRINIWDVYAELQCDAKPAEIAELYMLSEDQIHAALQYIDENKDEVVRGFERVKQRERRGNPPELQAKLDQTHAKYAPMWAELRRRFGNNGAPAYHGANCGIPIRD